MSISTNAAILYCFRQLHRIRTGLPNSPIVVIAGEHDTPRSTETGSILRTLSKQEMDAYRAPFPTPQSRRPILALPRDLPIAGEPVDVYAMSEHDQTALRASTYPKLLFSADPGALISPARAKAFAAELRNCRHIELGPGAHFLQEDHPDVIGQALRAWIAEIAAVSVAA